MDFILVRYEFSASNLLILVQMIGSASILFTCRKFGIVKFPAPNLETSLKVRTYL